ncbi:MAG TPA: nicotinamide riboside transporter PnuC [Flavitalea sp.]|nr:nicotinamide riboside transporter PnuC [Flavitalea sp.]
MHEFWQQFMVGMRETTPPEYIAVFAGIASVWLSRQENILLYPVGLINTVIYIYLSVDRHLFGEASVNLYYTIVSIYGWIIWSRKNERHQPVLRITMSNRKEWIQQLLFFSVFYIAIFCALTYLQKAFDVTTIPVMDAFASATAYTGMWLMARKKVESWYWWIATNVASIPLYFIKGLSFTSVYYFILLLLAIFGLKEWKKKSLENRA